jgi:hypothetical protein
MEQETKNTETVVEETTQVESEQTETVETHVEETEKPKTKNDILRELSKEHGVSLFDVEGLQQFKEYTESQKTEQQKLQEKLEAYENEKAQWESKQLEYEAKLKASELGIRKDALEDALKLANNDPNNLAEVLKKYPTFKNTDGVRIGVQDTGDFRNPTGNTEVEQYMAERAKENPLYAKYVKK